MKKDETLCYKLAEFGRHKITMSVHLHRTPAGYWRFNVICDLNMDMAERLLHKLARDAGFDENFDAVFHSTPKRGRFCARASMCTPYFCDGEYFPDRASVMKLIEEVFLPCWQDGVHKILECSTPGDSWFDALIKAEKKYFPRLPVNKNLESGQPLIHV